MLQNSEYCFSTTKYRVLLQCYKIQSTASVLQNTEYCFSATKYRVLLQCYKIQSTASVLQNTEYCFSATKEREREGRVTVERISPSGEMWAVQNCTH